MIAALARAGRRIGPATLLRGGGGLALLVWALLTPGFLSRLSLMSMLSAISFVGCVTVGMSFITISGNIMSLALGATVSAASVVFMASLGAGLTPAVLIALGFGAAITAAQGAVVGHFRANAILVSIAALTLILGVAAHLTGGERIYPGGNEFAFFKGRIITIPFETWLFAGCALAGQAVLSFTRVGRDIIMTGSNRQAAETVGINVPMAVIAAYAIAGATCALAGILLAARYGSGDMDLGSGYEYRAIAAVLVGGTAIKGGAGSVLRGCAGVIVITAIEMVLRLRGYGEEWQYLITGLVLLAVIMVQYEGARR